MVQCDRVRTQKSQIHCAYLRVDQADAGRLQLVPEVDYGVRPGPQLERQRQPHTLHHLRCSRWQFSVRRVVNCVHVPSGLACDSGKCEDPFSHSRAVLKIQRSDTGSRHAAIHQALVDADAAHDAVQCSRQPPSCGHFQCVPGNEGHLARAQGDLLPVAVHV